MLTAPEAVVAAAPVDANNAVIAVAASVAAVVAEPADVRMEGKGRAAVEAGLTSTPRTSPAQVRMLLMRAQVHALSSHERPLTQR